MAVYNLKIDGSDDISWDNTLAGADIVLGIDPATPATPVWHTLTEWAGISGGVLLQIESTTDVLSWA